jgi:hypothetical protein
MSLLVYFYRFYIIYTLFAVYFSVLHISLLSLLRTYFLLSSFYPFLARSLVILYFIFLFQ